MSDAEIATEQVDSGCGNDVTADISRSFHRAERLQGNQGGKIMEKGEDKSNHVITSSTNPVEGYPGLIWKDGIGVLPGTDMKFRVNELGDVIMISSEGIDTDAEHLGSNLQTDSFPDATISATTYDAGNHDNGNPACNEIQHAEVTSGGDGIVKKENLPARPVEVCTDDANRQLVKSAQSFQGNEALTKCEYTAYLKADSTMKKTSEGTAAVCAFCQASGHRSTFWGRFCSKQCVAKNAARHRQKLYKSSLLTHKAGRKRKASSATSTDGYSFLTADNDHIGSNLKMKFRRNTSLNEVDEDYDPSSRRRSSMTSIPHRPKEEFSWKNYLAAENAIAAPPSIFRKLGNQDPFPAKKNLFKVGSFLEAIDPAHQSMIAFVSVASIIGHRLRLHFDGYPSVYDFWVNSDSPLIFPCGFCEKTGRSLSPPCGYESRKFNWRSFVKDYSLHVAPDEAFSNLEFENRTGFKEGDRLEAVDRHHPELTCVASVTDAIGDYLLVHFDGWNSCYDYWTLHSSNHIRPIGWCAGNGKELTPPLGFDENRIFSWETYLENNNCKAADASLFAEEAHGFEVGMKLEVVDPRNQILVRVSSVAAIDEFRIKIHFDGWSEVYDYWFDADNRDLHPIDWCSRTEEDLQVPVNYRKFNDNDQTSCPVKGCLGIGHVKHDKFLSHHSEFGCPYSKEKLNRDPMPDRLTYDKASSHEDVIIDGNNNTKENATVVVKRRRGRPRLHSQLSVHESQTSREFPKPRDSHNDNVHTRQRRHSRLRALKLSDFNAHSPLYEAAFLTSVSERQHQRESTVGWDKHVLSLPGVQGKNASEVSNWSAEKVSSFVNQLTNKTDCGDVFVSQEIDGEAFLMLTQSDITSVLKLKLGPSVKIFNAILKIKTADPLQE